MVKEEIVGDDTPLPLYNNRVVCWLELAQGSVVSGGGGGSSGGGGGGAGGAAHQQQHDPHRHHHNDDLDSNSEAMTLPPRGPGVGETRPPSFQ